jgi:predicted dehydrogenase
MTDQPTHQPPLRYAMIGGGADSFIGAVHRKAAALDGQAVLVAGALSSTPDRSLESAKRLGIAPDRAYPDWRTLLEREAELPIDQRVDFVSIVTPNDLHYPVAKAALRAGFHVVCDKPFTHTSAQAAELRDLAVSRGLVCAVTYNYSGYPMVRQAAEMVAAGELGVIRKVMAEYLQGWLSTPLEATGMKQAAWRTDPARAGLGGALGDIGTHAEHTLSFVTGLRITELAADCSAFVPGRQLDDDATILLRFENGARGVLTCSQVLTGEGNNQSLRVYGEKGSLIWRQEDPDQLLFMPLDGQPRLYTRGGPGVGQRAAHATRIPQGHPEGFLEAFANIYLGAIQAIRATRNGGVAGPLAAELPTAEDGLRGVRFIEAAVRSSAANAAWTRLGD